MSERFEFVLHTDFWRQRMYIFLAFLGIGEDIWYWLQMKYYSRTLQYILQLTLIVTPTHMLSIVGFFVCSNQQITYFAHNRTL